MKGIYFIISVTHPELYLDVEGASRNHGAKLLVWSKNENTNQKFRFNPGKSDITSVNSILFLILVVMQNKILILFNDFDMVDLISNGKRF
jgi:hypothetical protein